MALLNPLDIRLRFVPLASVLLHEETDPSRVKRMEVALARDGILRNPPIAAEYDSRYVILDGASRTSALRASGFRDILLQIVDYESDTVALGVWHHVVAGLSPKELLTGLTSIDELIVQPVDAGTAHRKLAAQEIVACVSLPDDRMFAVLCREGITCQARLLCRVVAVYRGKTDVYRITKVEMPALLAQYPDLSAVFAFRAFYPRDIMQIVGSGGLVPMGITRHLISGRVLGLNAPLEMFTDSQSLASKNDWLENQIRQCVRDNKIRLYQEPVFVFDD
ncbi:MAG: hypothetical protein ACE5GO_05435 [Anaerolineales bacterium]